MIIAIGVVAALIAVLVVVLVTRSSDSKPSGALVSSGSSSDTSTTLSSGASPSSETTAPGGGPAPLPLGTVADAPLPPAHGNDPVCAVGFDCKGVSVTCPGVKGSMVATIATQPPSSRPTGVTMFFSGADGTNWWADSPDPDPVFSKLEASGLELVQVRWEGRGWISSEPGEEVGPAVLACRPATLVKWAYDTIFKPMGVQAPKPGACGFCITGNSGGSSQASYALTHYGLEPIIDRAVLTSGPPHAALAKGCLRNPGDEAFYYDNGNANSIDASYGFEGADGPCIKHDATYTDKWNRDSCDGPLGNYTLTHAFVSFIFGDNDPTVAPPHGEALANLLTAAFPDRVNVAHIPHQRHPIAGNPGGTEALRKALTGA